MPRKILLNGRFLTRPMTGVDRVACELTRALSASAQFTRHYEIEVLSPKASASALGGHFWEQTALAHHMPGAPLLSLCNTGPILRSNQIVMLHDAQVWRAPESYPPLFRHCYRSLLPLLGRRAKTLITVSNFAKNELEHFGIAPKNEIIVLPNGADHILRDAADLEILKRHNLQPHCYFLTVGAAAKHKNLDIIAKAHSLRSSPPIPLIAAGSRTAPTPFNAIGRVSDRELRALYENASALLFPSFTEGFGLPAAEAMMCGCPVVATTQGAVPEVCDAAAILCDPSDAHAWAHAMDQLAERADLRARLSAAGRYHIAHFTWSNAAERLTNIIQKHCAYPSVPNPLGAA